MDDARIRHVTRRGYGLFSGSNCPWFVLRRDADGRGWAETGQGVRVTAL